MRRTAFATLTASALIVAACGGGDQSAEEVLNQSAEAAANANLVAATATAAEAQAINAVGSGNEQAIEAAGDAAAIAGRAAEKAGDIAEDAGEKAKDAAH